MCPGYDQMFCSEPFALNYRETAVYATHCCSELNAMSIFYQTSSVRNKVMVKFHKLKDDFVFQAIHEKLTGGTFAFLLLYEFGH